MAPPPEANRRAAAAAALALLVLAPGLAACRPRAAAPRTNTAESPRRLVSMAPHLTEIVFDLGLGDRLVGVDDHSGFPAAATKRTRVGHLFAPRFETLVSLDPDLVLLLPSHHDMTARLDALGIPHQSFPHESIADIASTMRRLGQLCDVADVAARRIRVLEDGIAPRDVLAGATVLVAVGRPGGEARDLVAAGPGTFLDELVIRLGGRNALADAPALWPRLALEELVARDPDWIVELDATDTATDTDADNPPPTGFGEAQRATSLAAWRRLPGLSAPRSGRLLLVQGSHTLVPGPRLVALYRELARRFEPRASREPGA